LDAARAQVETLRGTWREAVSELADAEARAAYFLRQSQRQEELAIKGVASVSKRDESQNDARAAADRVATVREKLQRVLTALNGDPQLPADLHPMVRDKTAARERAALDLARTTVRAPVDGVVVNLRVQQGEQVKAATPLFVLVVVSRPWVEANFKETELTHVKVGQKATVVLDTYPDTTWEAVVESLSNQVAGKRMLLARARVARDVIPRELRKLGAQVDVVEAYETVIPQSSRTRLRATLNDSRRRPNVITFTSSSTVRNFVALLGNVSRGRPRPRKAGSLDGICLASIGPITSSTLRELGLPVDIEAKEYTIPGLIKALAIFRITRCSRI
jgi:multidrug efflux pump subunit AcrA (membrane-fusion protein)